MSKSDGGFIKKEKPHNNGHDNVIPHVMNKKEELQVEKPSTKTHALRAIFQRENNLE
jgi:hypothetical protein